MIEAGIVQLVVADADVQALIGNRLAPALTSDSPVYPCADYRVIDDLPDYTLAGSRSINVMRVQIDARSGNSYLEAKSVSKAIRSVLELYVGLLPDGTRVAVIFVANAHDFYDPEARCYGNSTDYLIHYYSS